MLSLFGPVSEPKTLLGRRRILSPTAGVRVSPLCLGGMNFGNAWKEVAGECSKETTFEILDHFYESGGNFIDTAGTYQDQESEQRIGEWMEKRGTRDEMVIATKFTANFQRPSNKQIANFAGNSSKSMHLAAEASLKKLRTSYIDILYLHFWDYTTSIEEVMQSANNLVRAGKVLYLGISDTPAWLVAKANMYARQHGLAQFVVYQGQWSASSRDFERDILPMCQDFGMAMATFGTLGAGLYKTAEQRALNEGRKTGEMSEVDIRVCEVLEKLAKKKGTIMTSIALAFVMHSAPNVYPIVGGRKVEHLKGNIEALKIRLSTEELEEIETASGFNAGFPQGTVYLQPYNTRLTPGDQWLNKNTAVLDTPSKPQPAFPPE